MFRMRRAGAAAGPFGVPVGVVGHPRHANCALAWLPPPAPPPARAWRRKRFDQKELRHRCPGRAPAPASTRAKWPPRRSRSPADKRTALALRPVLADWVDRGAAMRILSFRTATV